MSKEVKVGLLGIVSLVVLYLGFNFLKGFDVFSTENNYTVIFDEVNGLQNSNAVTYKGVTVGRVMKIETNQERGNVKVSLSINKKIKITTKTTALLADDGLISGKLIKLDIKEGDLLKDGQEINGGIEMGLADAAMQKITPALNDMDSLLVNLTNLVKKLQNTVPAVEGLITSATVTSNGVNGLMASNQKNLKQITGNAALLTNNLNTLTQSLDAQIKPILSKTSTLTDSLTNLQLGTTVGNLNQTIASLEGMVQSINQGKGTLGKLTSSDSLYLNLDHTAASLNALLADMKTNPKRYVHFSLFGGKKKEEKKKE